MITVYMEDQPGGVAGVLRDYNDAPYYPAPTTAAARVVMYARDKGLGADAAFVLVEGKPGGEFSIPLAALADRTLEVTTVTYSSAGTPSISNLEHAVWEDLNVAAGMITVQEIMVETAVQVGGEQVLGPREAAVSHVTAGTGSTVAGTAAGTYDAATQMLINDLVAQVNTLKAAVDANQSATNTTLTRLETHGLIDV